MKIANDNKPCCLIDRTREIWELRLRRELSLDEAKQIAANVSGFFSILAAWSRADLPAPVNDNVSGVTSADEGVRHDR